MQLQIITQYIYYTDSIIVGHNLVIEQHHYRYDRC